MAIAYNPKAVIDGLVLHIDAANIKSYNSATSTSTWLDLSGNSNNFTFTNTVTFVVNSFQFDGIASRAGVSTNITYGNNTTWEVWANRTSSVNTFNMVMGRYLPYFAMHSGNRIYFSNRVGGIQQTLTTVPGTIQDNRWYHLVFTTNYDGSTNTTMTIYINGNLTTSAAYTGTQSNTDLYPFVLGTWRPFNDSPFYGKIANVKVYNRTLSTEEIQQNFEALRGRYGI